MILAGPRDTSEPPRQTTTSGSRPKLDGSDGDSFSSLLFLVLSLPAAAGIAANFGSDGAADADERAPSMNAESSDETMHSDASADALQNYPVENQWAMGKFATLADSAIDGVPTDLEPSSGGSATVLNGTEAGDLLTASQSLTDGNQRIGFDLNTNQQPRPEQTEIMVEGVKAALVGVKQAAVTDGPMEAMALGQGVISVEGEKEPVGSNGDEKLDTDVNAGPPKDLQQTLLSGAVAQGAIATITSNLAVGNSFGTSTHQDESAVDRKKQFVASQSALTHGTSLAIAVPEETVRGQRDTKFANAAAKAPCILPENSDRIVIERANDGSQDVLASKPDSQLYSGFRPNAKNEDESSIVFSDDKLAQGRVEPEHQGAQRLNGPAASMVWPTAGGQASASVADAPASSWRPVVERITGEVAGRVKLGKQEAVIQLDPPELGKIRIDLHVEGDKLQARILTETHESRALIESHLHDLRQAFQAKDLQLVDLQVQGGGHGGVGDGMRGFSEQQQRAGRDPEEHWASGHSIDNDSVEPQRTKPAILHRGGVSMWA